MADILSIFGVLLIVGLAFPALLITVWLTLPAAVDRACQRIILTPRRCLAMGAGALMLVGGMAALLLAAPSAAAKALGWIVIFATLAGSTVGAAGLAACLSQQLHKRSQGGLSALRGFLSGALLLELAAAFPIVGWATVLPIALIMALGATVFALLRWRPRMQPEPRNVRPAAVSADLVHG